MAAAELERVGRRVKVRRDQNEREIVRALERAGARVYRVKVAEPAGLPDLAVFFRGRWHLLECKSAAGVLSEAQANLVRLGASRVVRTPLEGLLAIGAVSGEASVRPADER